MIECSALETDSLFSFRCRLRDDDSPEHEGPAALGGDGEVEARELGAALGVVWEWCNVEVRKTDDGLAAQNTE